jgi:predicted ATPase
MFSLNCCSFIALFDIFMYKKQVVTLNCAYRGGTSMLTRLKINGFKNLVDVDVRFGPFTCIAGANGVGKSNLFDAIRFLSALANTTLLDAASFVRGKEKKTPDVKSLFNRKGPSHAKSMRFEAEMIVPKSAVDDLGKEGKAKITILRYTLELKYRDPESRKSTLYGSELEIVYEELNYIQKGEARKHLGFKPTKAWLDTAVSGASRSPFISTKPAKETKDGRTIIKLHQDGNQGRPSYHVAESLPRTVLSSGSASESPTVLCARREMESWKLLQLEPSALRKPSDFNSPSQLSADGSFLSSTLYHMAKTLPDAGVVTDEDAVYCRIANRLSELIGHVDSLWIDRDEKRELFTLMLKERNGTELPAHALSDGTLRFLSLSVIEMDSRSGGVICLEEPENGIHPARIPAMLCLLQDIATDIDELVDADNPLRQVIVNTHSPAVVSEVPDDSLLVAELVNSLKNGIQGSEARFSCLTGTWRDEGAEKSNVVAKGKLLTYLNPRAILPVNDAQSPAAIRKDRHRKRKVRERKDLQMLLPLETGSCS